jgi:hypothetical protein
MDELDRRLRDLADGVGPTHVPADLGRRIARRRRTRAAVVSAGGAAGVVLAGAVGLGVWTGQEPPTPPARTASVATACDPDALLTGPPQTVPDEPSAQVATLTLDRSAPVSCTVGTFRVVADDGTELVRATLSDVDLDPGATVDLRIGWDAAATCATRPSDLLADETVVASIAVPTCGDVTLTADVRPAS